MQNSQYSKENLQNIYNYYCLDHSLQECIQYFNLKLSKSSSGGLKVKLVREGFVMRTLSEDQELFRRQGKYPKKKLSPVNTKGYWTEEKKEKHRIRMQQVVRDNPESYALKPYFTRVKSHLVPNHNGEQISVRGLYELEFANYLNRNNIKWDKVTKGFDYAHNGNSHQYFPDFFLSDYNVYVEIKGRVVEKDISKCLGFKHPLLYLFDDEIKAIKQNSYNLDEEIENLNSRNYSQILKEMILSYKRKPIDYQ